MRYELPILAALVASCAALPSPTSSPSGQLPGPLVPSFFGGAAAGYATFHDYEEDPGDRVDDEDTSTVFFAGYQFSPFYAMLLGYFDFGSLYAEGPADGGFTDDISYDGISLMALRLMPIDHRSAAFVSAGLLHWNQKVRYRSSFGPFNADESGTSPALGLGYDRHLGDDRNWALHVAYNHFFEVGDYDATGHDSDIGLFSVGVLFRP